MTKQDPPSTARFVNALEANAARYGIVLTAEATAHLRDFYEHMGAWNARLHLVAPCSPEEFATRHVLESLCALPHLPEGAHVTDVGSGAGLPVVPCLIVRPDIRAALIESSARKAVYLREALRRVKRHDAATVVASRFENTPAPETDVVTCRALDRFTEMFPKLLAWSPPRATLLFFGGNSLRERIENVALAYTSILLPESEQRFLFIIHRA